MQWLQHLRRRVERETAVSSREDAEHRGSEQALSRYRALVRTASPEAIEQAYEEGLRGLSVPQRGVIREELQRLEGGAASRDTPETLEPAVLAGTAARIERRQPAFLELFVHPRGRQASVFAALLASVIASEPAARVLGRAAQPPSQDASKAPESSEPDITGEFGHEGRRTSAVGGSGFEHDEFDFEV